MSDYTSISRSRRFQKRRNNKRKLLFFSILALFFFIVLISLITLGNKEEQNEAKENENEIIENNEQTDDISNSSDSSETDVEQNELGGLDAINDLGDVVVEQVEPTGENVIEAFVGNWPPSGTIQEGPHTTDYSDGSQDRIEIRRAVSYVTGIPENDMIEWRVENGGEQKVIATVSNRDESEYYRVYLDWLDGEGWKPTLSERITGY